ncbi:MAG: DNA gyrase subunit A [Clostridia bacterium]|nr:DNA gyrase subunit A [Clostridia bacterium]MBQ5742572.1 DNA gyrase subunit A [Clostridia bacterium]
MAHNRSYKPEDILFPNQVITQSNLVEEMEKSYIEYAMSVIVGRALPDVRDGLKPVHRRILYTMYESGLTSDKPFKKSATCVGDVLGKYHPHGDTSVYDAMVRLAQNFSMRYMLVDGHGNFGSVDGDPPAAYRYTEARLSKMSNEMLRDIDKETVNWDPNFDESRKEPRVLPSRFPNLLVNGSSGIAVGMATNIPPHNLKEVINAAVAVLDDPEIEVLDLLEYISGPDFPTGGIIMGRRGIRAAYATGRGKVVVRAKTEFEEFNKDRVRIIVSELPYQVNKRQLIKSIADLVKDKKIDGISDLRDETDRNGMRMVIELKKDANPQVVLNTLFKQTSLQSSFGVILLALVDDQKQPKILSLKQILEEYLTFQKEVLTRRTQYDLKKARERAHLLEGLLIAQDNIDEVIRIIRTAYDDAKQKLMERFHLDDIQAQAILDMRLKALQGLDREKLQNEYNELQTRIAYYLGLLEDPAKLAAVLREELLEIRDKFGDERKTEIVDVEDEIDIEDLIEEKTSVFTMSHRGYIKRQPEDVYKVQNRGGRGINAMSTREEDFVEELFIASTHATILFFTTKGRVFRIKGYEIPEASRQAKGMNIVNLLQLDQGEVVSAMIPLYGEIDDENTYLNMITKAGITKRSRLSEYRNIRKGGLIAVNLDEGDELVSVKLTDGSKNILIITHNGMGICYDENQVSVVGRTARGVKAIKLDDGDEIISSIIAEEDQKVLIVTENGMGKRTEFSEFKIQHRGGRGVHCHNVTEKTGLIAGAKAVTEKDDVVIISSDGVLIRIRVEDVPVYRRTSSGVKIMRVQGETKVMNIAALPKAEEEGEEVPEETQE